MSLPRNARGGYKVSLKAPSRRKKRFDGRVYEDAQPWHPDSPRVRVKQAFLVPRALFTALCNLSGHQGKIVGQPGWSSLCELGEPCHQN